MVTVKIHLAQSLRLVWGGKYDMRFEVWPQFWPFTGLDYVGIMDFAARKSTIFGQKSTEKHSKWGKRPLLLSLGARCCRFESCHFDHMKIIRTFSYLEKRSDYLFYLSILALIARNEDSRYHGLLTMVSAFVLLKKTHFYDIINTSKYFWKTYWLSP